MKPLQRLVIYASTIMVTACSSMPGLPIALLGFPAAGAGSAHRGGWPALPETATARERVSRAVDLLAEGDAENARIELRLALAKAPKDTAALKLMQQIDVDPVMLLGAANQPYVVGAGDTMSVLASRFLGDPLMFYVLGRYNGLAAPNMLTVGKTLKIPLAGGAGQAEIAPLASSGAAAATVVPGADTSRGAGQANAIRLKGLESLNKGDVTQAVTLLKQAEAMNRDDPAIRRDLQRALRIQSALVDG